MNSTVVIAGAGQAAAQLVASLRAHGHEGRIVLYGDEGRLPYHRPPLSKKFLRGDLADDKLPIRKLSYYETHGVELHLGTPLARVDRSRGQVCDVEGRWTPYDHLVIATGGRARRLSCVPDSMPGVHVLRTLDDALQLKSELGTGRRAVLIGGGYVGLETAATLRDLGCEVTVVEAQAEVLARSAAPPVAEFLRAEHARRGCDVRCRVGVEAILGETRFEAVQTTRGDVLEGDLLIVGVGMQPNSELAEAAGLACDDGIVVDHHARTSDPRIFAIGDVARFRDPASGTAMRLESVDNAIQMAKIAAASICQIEAPVRPAPWFWSDQYATKLQMVGMAPADAHWLVRREDGASRLSCFYLKAGRLVAAQCLNSGGDFMVAKRLVASGQSLDPELLTDPEFSLRELSSMSVEVANENQSH